MTIDQFVNLTSGEYLACLEFVYERLIKCEFLIIYWIRFGKIEKVGLDFQAWKRCKQIWWKMLWMKRLTTFTK